MVAAGVADTLLSGGGSDLDARLHPGLVPSAHSEFFAFWRSEADSLGGDPGVEVIGTSSPEPSGGRTLVRPPGSRGGRVLSLDWVRGGLIGSQPVPAEGVELEFFREANDSLVRYDLWTDRTVRLRGFG